MCPSLAKNPTTFVMMSTQEKTSSENGRIAEKYRNTDHSPQKDLALVQTAAAGNREAREALVAHVCPRILKALTLMSSNPHEVDDLVQNALMEVLSSLASFRGECPLIFWAERIAIRTAGKTFRRNRRNADLMIRVARNSEVTPVCEQLDGEQALAKEQFGLHFRKCLEVLSPGQRTAIIAHHVNGYSLKEIAELCECSVFTIKGRLRRGRRLLKKVALTDPVLQQWLSIEFKGGEV